jgi:hypothetical protein
MASFYAQAGEAIGSVVRDIYPRNAHNWGNITPSNDWGMELPRWAEIRDDVRERFEELILPCRVRTGESFSGARTKPLYQLQERLANSVVCPGDDDAEEV